MHAEIYGKAIIIIVLLSLVGILSPLLQIIRNKPNEKLTAAVRSCELTNVSLGTESPRNARSLI